MGPSTTMNSHHICTSFTHATPYNLNTANIHEYVEACEKLEGNEQASPELGIANAQPRNYMLYIGDWNVP